jgi:Asp-tRNA(Asn)/Glu-tRNA(Gln) amidotransferase A subunit family amidase
MDSYAWTSAAGLAAAIRSKELSPVELMDAVLARIDARNPSINAHLSDTVPRVRTCPPVSLRMACSCHAGQAPEGEP